MREEFGGNSRDNEPVTRREFSRLEGTVGNLQLQTAHMSAEVGKVASGQSEIITLLKHRDELAKKDADFFTLARKAEEVQREAAEALKAERAKADHERTRFKLNVLLLGMALLAILSIPQIYNGWVWLGRPLPAAISPTH